MSRTIAAVALLLLSSSLAVAEPQKEFKLAVGKNNYDVAEGQPFKIVTPKGETVEVVLTRSEILHYAEHGVVFDYNRQMKVSAEEDSGVATITAETTDSTLCMIQVYNLPTTPEEVRKQLMDVFRREFTERKATFIEGSGRKLTRPIHKVDIEGQVLEFFLAGERLSTQVFTYKKGSAIVGVVLQSSEKDSEMAQKLFDVITTSLQ